MRLIAALVVTAILAATTAEAADLLLKASQDGKTATVTNTTDISVTMLYLVGPDNKRLPLFGRIGPKETVAIPLRFKLPEKVTNASCEIASPPEGYTKGRDGYFHLSVDVL